VRLDVPTAIELGGDHFCRVTCWGGGTGDASGTYTPMTNATALIPRQACAQNASGFHCWQGHDRVSEPEVEPAMDGAVTGWSSFAVGDNHACGLRGEQVECRGETEYGVLGGPPSADDHGAYHRLDLADVVEVRSAEYFTCARTRVGDVYCWGLLLLMRPPIKPTRLFRKARAIAATDAAVCAEGTDGRIRCVGELGYGSRIKTPTPVEIKPLRGVTGLRGGVHHLCGLRRGAVVCWGENGMGQLGAGHRRETQKAATVRLGTRKAVSVAPFFRHTCALDDAGATWCWGDNRDGVVFKERLVIRRTPQPIVGLR
jgi:hypothetical protein